MIFIMFFSALKCLKNYETIVIYFVGLGTYINPNVTSTNAEKSIILHKETVLSFALGEGQSEVGG